MTPPHVFQLSLQRAMDSACTEMWEAVVRLQLNVHGASTGIVYVSPIYCGYHKGKPWDPERMKATLSKSIDAEISVHCRRSLKLAAMSVALHQAMPETARPRLDAYEREVRQETQRLLSKHTRVAILGISYGGLVACRVAQSLIDDPRARKLSLYTFGSIYIPSAAIPRSLHFVYTGDRTADKYTGYKADYIHSADREFASFDPGTRMVWLSASSDYDLHNAYLCALNALLSEVDVIFSETPSLESLTGYWMNTAAALDEMLQQKM